MIPKLDTPYNELINSEYAFKVDVGGYMGTAVLIQLPDGDFSATIFLPGNKGVAETIMGDIDAEQLKVVRE